MDQSTINKVVESYIRKEMSFPANVDIFLRNSVNPVEFIIYNRNAGSSLVIPSNGINIRKEIDLIDMDNLFTLGKFSYEEKDKETLFKIIMICFENYSQ